MRIVIEAIGSYGDVFPMYAIGRALSKRGHKVIFVSNSHFESLVTDSDLEFVVIGSPDEYEVLTKKEAIFFAGGFEVLLEHLSSNLVEHYQKLIRHIQPGNTILIGSSLSYAARLAEETHHVPAISVHLVPSVFRSLHEVPPIFGLAGLARLPLPFKRLVWWFIDKKWVDPMFSKHLDQIRSDLNLPAGSRILYKWIHAPDLVLAMFPEWFAKPVQGWPEQTRCTGFPLFDNAATQELDEDVRLFLEEGDKPVVFSTVSVVRHDESFFEESVETCRLLNVRGILLTPFSEQIPDSLPENIRHYEYVPISLLLPHAAVIVHHGGIGTGSQALRAGVPQLIRPCGLDTFDNAERIVQLGVGQTISRETYKAEAVAEKLKAIMETPMYTEKCEEFAAKFEGVNPIEDSCDLIEEVWLKRNGGQSA